MFISYSVIRKSSKTRKTICKLKKFIINSCIEIYYKWEFITIENLLQMRIYYK